MSNTLYTQDEAAITRTLDVNIERTPEELGQTLEELYDIPYTAEQIVQGDYKRIALQFPDELLPYSVPVFRALKTRTPGRDSYVLADTSYGSCCVDEVAAQHIDADVVVHYGHACLSPTSRLPTIYVFGKRPIDVDHAAETLCASASSILSTIDEDPSKVLVIMYDVAYAHQADLISSTLRGKLPPSLPSHMSTLESRLVPPSVAPPTSTSVSTKPTDISLTSTKGNAHPRHNRLPPGVNPEDAIIFYIGGESLGLTNLLLTHSSSEVHSYDPQTRIAKLESGRSNRLLMRRFAAVQAARDADVFGILVGTLGVASYLPLISHLRRSLALKKKKSYTISVGKLNPAKLANFLEIECFVLVACPENSVIDAKEFLRPIVTPHELHLALSDEDGAWTTKYLLDFDEVLAEQQQKESTGTKWGDDQEEKNDDDESDTDRPTFSLITGTYRHAKRYGEIDRSISNVDSTGDASALALRNNEGALSKVMESAAGQFLSQRTYRGLEQNIGQDEPSILELGRSGIARGYGETRGIGKEKEAGEDPAES